MQDLVDSLPFSLCYQAAFRHAGRTQVVTLQAGVLHIRLPDTQQELWVLVAYNDCEKRTLVLLTNVPLLDDLTIRQVYRDWPLARTH